MHPSTVDVMRWILRAGGQVNVVSLAAWRWPRRAHGPREARRFLGLLEDRGWLKRLGTPRYPWWTVTRLGALEAAAAGIEVQHKVTLEPKPSRVHDAELAAILEAGVRQDDPAWAEWRSPGEFGRVSEVDKIPDALLLSNGGQWHAVEAEFSKKGGARTAGRSNWASTAESAVARLYDPQVLLIDGEKVKVQHTVFVFPDDKMARAFAPYAERAATKAFEKAKKNRDLFEAEGEDEPEMFGLESIVLEPHGLAMDYIARGVSARSMTLPMYVDPDL